MGVPALFRWLSAKYPKIIEPVQEVKHDVVDGQFVPVNLLDPNPNGVEFDNLYLDMNGIIHPCCHPENQAAPPTEQDMMVEIFKYIDRIFGMVRPRKVLYLAIDGVAPRAKMNQQRSRRFRAAMEAKLKAEKEAEIREENGLDSDDYEDGEPFDSNCITPGTPFMSLVAESLKYYTLERMNNNPAWKDIKVILSDASVPGEGEHKIMDFIRRQRLDPSYDPNTRHVIYGLDADLIMLSMATHEPYFKVLREDVFAQDANNRTQNCRKCGEAGHWGDECPGKVKKPTDEDIAEQTNEKKEYKLIEKPFIFLDVPTLREYLEAEMKPKDNPGFPFEAERAIDDWIFMCFFVGNDFLPHLPSLEIREGAIDILIDLYKSNAHRLKGYICKDGVVNLARVELLMEELGKMEELIFRKRREKEERRIENAKRRKLQANEAEAQREYRRAQLELHQAQFNSNDPTSAEQTLRDQNRAAAQALKKQPAPEANTDDVEPEDNVRLWEPGFRDRYYAAKFKDEYEIDSTKLMSGLTRSYAEGLCWVMAYYYQGCPSWKWYYPYHYAPFAADLKGIGELHLAFELGEPFRPFDQLMGVFPAASSSHIPEQFRHLMTDESSAIIEFYPETFLIDMNGKKQSWQGVALLPFIDEEVLLKALEEVYPLLTPEQIKLNSRGDSLLFVYSTKQPLFPPGLAQDDEDKMVLSLDPSICNGVAGYARLVRSLCDLGKPYNCPLNQIENLQVIESNMVRAFAFFNPYHERAHIHFRSRILPGCQLPEPRLTEEDRYNVRSGAASRSFSSRLVLNGNNTGRNGGYGGVRQNHHSMHQEYNQSLETRHQQPHYNSHKHHRHEERPVTDYSSHGNRHAYHQNPYAALAPTSHHSGSSHHSDHHRHSHQHQGTSAESMYPPPLPASSNQSHRYPPPWQQPALGGFHRPPPPPPAPSSQRPPQSQNPWDLNSLYGSGSRHHNYRR